MPAQLPALGIALSLRAGKIQTLNVHTAVQLYPLFCQIPLYSVSPKKPCVNKQQTDSSTSGQGNSLLLLVNQIPTLLWEACLVPSFVCVTYYKGKEGSSFVSSVCSPSSLTDHSKEPELKQPSYKESRAERSNYNSVPPIL